MVIGSFFILCRNKLYLLKNPHFFKFQDDAYVIKFLCKCNSALWRSVTCVTFINQCPLLLTLQVLLTWTFNILHPDN